jgi:hypothetical protein
VCGKVSNSWYLSETAAMACISIQAFHPCARLPMRLHATRRDGTTAKKPPKAKNTKDPSINYTKPSKDSKETVLDFLSRRFLYHTPTQWQV